MTTLITQQDSIDLNQLVEPVEAFAAYVGGYWPDYSPACKRWPKALKKSIAVNAAEDADILDIEAGDATPTDFPAWFKRQKARGLDLPGAYASQSLMPAVLAAARAAEIKDDEYVRWVAHYDGVPTLSSVPADLKAKAKQYTDHGHGRNLDLSVCDPSFFGAAPPKPIVNAPHYDWFATGPFLLHGLRLNERNAVKFYDKLRAKETKTLHPSQAILAALRLILGWLAGRVRTVAADSPRSDGRPSWNVDHRGWRFQQLIHRAHGQRLA